MTNILCLSLQKDDYRNFTIGYDTNCCQHYGSIGGECLPCYCHDPYAGAVVIVKNSQMYGDKWLTGGAIAQAFTWVDNDKSTIVFDNMEFARAEASITMKRYLSLMTLLPNGLK